MTQPFKATAWLGNEAAAVSGDAHIFHHSLDPKFVAYFFQTADFQRQKQAHLTERRSGGFRRTDSQEFGFRCRRWRFSAISLKHLTGSGRWKRSWKRSWAAAANTHTT